MATFVSTQGRTDARAGPLFHFGAIRTFGFQH